MVRMRSPVRIRVSAPEKQSPHLADAHKKVLDQRRFGHLSGRDGKQKRIVVFNTAVRFLYSYSELACRTDPALFSYVELFKSLCYFFLESVTLLPCTVLIAVKAFQYGKKGDESIG